MALIATLTDDFSGTTLDLGKWKTDHIAGTHTVGSGLLTLSLNTAGATDRAQITSVANNYQLSGSSIIAKLTPSPADNTETGLIVADPASSGLATIRFIGIYASATMSNNSAVNILDAVTSNYIPAQWAYVRITQDPAQGTTYFHRSPDGTTWTLLGSAPTPGWGNNVEVRLKMSNWNQVVTGTRTASFDLINYPLLEALKDDFSTGTLDATKWTVTPSAGTSYNLTGGTFNVATLAGYAVGDNAFRLKTAANFTLTESSVLAKVTPSGNASQYAYFEVLGNTGGENFLISSIGTNITFQGFDGGSYIASATATYDATSMAWWRIRRTGTALYWETSPDGSAWTARASAAAYTLKSATYIFNLRTNWNATSTATTVSFDNVNTPPPPPPLIETLTENFTAGTLDVAKWKTPTVSGGCTYTVSGGTFNMNTAAGQPNGQVILNSVQNYSFADTSVFAKVTPSTTNGQYVEMSVKNATTGEFFKLQKINTILNILLNDGTTNIVNTNVSYDSTAMAWWRIRHTGNITYFDTSPDATTWTSRANGTNALKSPTYFLEFQTSWAGTTSATTVQVDNVNTPPPPPPLIETLTDDFSTGTLDTTKWTATAGSGTSYNLTGGTFNIVTAAGTASGANSNFDLTSVLKYTIAGSSALVKVLPITAGNQSLSFVVGSIYSEFFRIYSNGTTMTCDGFDGATYIVNVGGIPYNATTMAWWRIRRTGTALFWETSPDALTWTQRATTASYTLKSASYNLTLTSSWNATTTATTAKFDNVNITVYAATVTPDGITAPEAFGNPTLVQAASTNASYQAFRDGLMTGDYDLLNGVIKIALVKDYLYDASDQYMADVTAAGGVVTAVSPALTGPVIGSAAFDADDTVLNTTADPAPHILVGYQASDPTGGADLPEDQQRLMWYFETGGGLPVIPGTGTVTVAWPNTAGKIYKIG